MSKTGKLEFGALSVNESNLLTKIAEDLRKQFPVLTAPQGLSYAERVLEEIENRGAGAVYEGLVELGRIRAAQMYEQDEKDKKNNALDLTNQGSSAESPSYD